MRVNYLGFVKSYDMFLFPIISAAVEAEFGNISCKFICTRFFGNGDLGIAVIVNACYIFNISCNIAAGKLRNFAYGIDILMALTARPQVINDILVVLRVNIFVSVDFVYFTDQIKILILIIHYGSKTVGKGFIIVLTYSNGSKAVIHFKAVLAVYNLINSAPEGVCGGIVLIGVAVSVMIKHIDTVGVICVNQTGSGMRAVIVKEKYRA